MYKILFSIISFFIIADVDLAAADRPSHEIKLTYKAYWGGFVISKVYSTTHIGPADYQMDVTYEVTGLAAIFSNFRNKSSAQGKIAPDGTLKPLIFENQGSWSRYNFRIRTIFQEEDSKILSHDYAFKFREKVKYVPIRDELKYGPDMISFYLGLTLDEQEMAIGPEIKHQNVFGGFYLLDIAYRCPETKVMKSRRSIYKGEALVCEFNDKVVGGSFERIKKKKKSKRKKRKKEKRKKNMEPVPLQVWYAKVGDVDAMIPVYSEFAIGWGKVRLYLSDMQVTVKTDMNATP